MNEPSALAVELEQQSQTHLKSLFFTMCVCKCECVCRGRGPICVRGLKGGSREGWGSAVTANGASRWAFLTKTYWSF